MSLPTGQAEAVSESVWQSRLWRKYAAVMVALCGVAIGGYGALELAVAYTSAKAQAAQLQGVEAGEAALALRAALVNVDRHVSAVNELPWRPGWLSLDTRREEFGRLLRMVPAAESITYRNPAGQEMLRVSRREIDRVVATPGVRPAPGPASGPASATASAPVSTAAAASAAASSPAAAVAFARTAPAYGQVLYSADLDPVLDLTLADPDPVVGGTTVVRLGLRALARDIRAALSTAGTEVYAVDRSGVIALHRDPTTMLARVRAPWVMPVPPAASAGSAAAPTLPAEEGRVVTEGKGLRDDEVLRAAVPLPELGWWMVVERPRSAVMAPVWATVRRAALILVLGVVAAMAAALWLAGRLTRPIRQLHGAAQRLGAGDLDTTIHIRSGDELESLAEQFNRMGASLRASVTDLEQRIAERTLDLERANRHKSDFLANMSHELRTPLNAILGFADVLREGMAGPVTDEQREYMSDIHASGLHLLSLINDVLDLSKIEAGQMDLEISLVDVPETVASAAALVRQRCVRQGLALAIELEPDVDTWPADGRRFKQILLNLLSNAVKFTPSGGRITVRGGLSPQAGLWMEVQDTGRGIAPADHETVFQEFRQVGSDSAGRAEGTGLGLALVRRLVQQHGGQVSLRSDIDAGACFHFNIPRRPE